MARGRDSVGGAGGLGHLSAGCVNQRGRFGCGGTSGDHVVDHEDPTHQRCADDGPAFAVVFRLLGKGVAGALEAGT
jgi:hypothetical protein